MHQWPEPMSSAIRELIFRRTFLRALVQYARLAGKRELGSDAWSMLQLHVDHYDRRIMGVISSYLIEAPENASLRYVKLLTTDLPQLATAVVHVAVRDRKGLLST